MVKNIGNHISEENLLIVLAEIMGIVTGAKITDYMHLKYRKKLLMRSWQNMRKEEVDEKVVLYIYVVANGYIGIIGCTSKNDEVRNGEANEDTPIHITIPKRRRSNFVEDIDTVSVVDENGEILYECNTNLEITIRLDDGILTVTVPKINDSCFDSEDLDE